jgi:phosphopantothenoylcysteine decarboxylase/phosphopantothenate--cysteine ligase
MAHIDWARWADVVVVAPATADLMNKLAAGVGDDMLTTLCLATEAPLVVAPAMNPSMYAHTATQASLEALRARAAWIVEPTEGDVACGEHGQGKLASVQAIVEAVASVAQRRLLLSGKRVLVTSGPTREPLDDVRFLSNRSSGKMGAALARAALIMGAEVTVVSGPARAPLPDRATAVWVETAVEMLQAALARAPNMDLIIGAAAVADYRPSVRHKGKPPRGQAPVELILEPNPDIIAALAKACPRAVTVAFAAEPGADVTRARRKLAEKGVRAVAVNDVSQGDIGFDSEHNDIVWLTKGGQDRSGRRHKLACAIWILERAAEML